MKGLAWIAGLASVAVFGAPHAPHKSRFEPIEGYGYYALRLGSVGWSNPIFQCDGFDYEGKIARVGEREGHPGAVVTPVAEALIAMSMYPKPRVEVQEVDGTRWFFERESCELIASVPDPLDAETSKVLVRLPTSKVLELNVWNGELRAKAHLFAPAAAKA